MSARKVTSGFAPSGDASIYFECAGSGYPIVFLHAGISDCRMWDAQFDHFAQRHRVIRYDSRGMGKTKMPKGAWTMHGDLRAVLAHLEVERATLIGCSQGGSTAIDFVLAWPEMVKAMVLSGSGLSGWKWSAEMQARMTETIAAYRIDPKRAFEMWASLWIDGVGRSPESVEPRYRDRARELMAANYPAAQAQLNPATIPNPLPIDRLSEIKVPTPVLIGSLEPRDLRDIAELLTRRISRSRLVELPNTAHLPSIEHPDEFNRIVEDFLECLN
jgi:pimeloyl-ACP methyl ester carboxylesterase